METIYKGVSTLTIGEWTHLFLSLQRAGAQDGNHAARIIGGMSDRQYEELMSLGTDWALRRVCATIDNNTFLRTYTLWRKK